MPRGGFRPGAGRKPGTKEKSTLEKEELRRQLRERVALRWGKMIEAQIDTSIGLSHFFLRDKATGQFKRLTDEKEIEQALNSDGDRYYIHTKDPNVAAFTDLANRTIDKPTDHVESEVSGNLEVKWMA